MEPTGETTLYRSGDTIVTDRQVRLGEASYPLSDIQTVSIVRPILKRSYGVIALAVGVVLTIVGYVVWNGVLLSPMVGGIALIIAGLALLATVRERYMLRLNGAGGNIAELSVADGGEAQRLAAAIAERKAPPLLEREVGG